MTNDLSCPHCGKLNDAFHAARHAMRCPENPAMLALIRAAIADPANPGHAVTDNAYILAAKQVGAPSLQTLRGIWGDWPATCARLGMLPPAPKVKAPPPPVERPHTAAERADMETQAIQETAAAVEADAAVRAWSKNYGLPVHNIYMRLNDRRWYCEVR